MIKDRELHEELAADIVALLRQHMGIRDPAIRREVTLQDLGMDGDDAVSFMTEFAEKFQIDMRHFDIRRHFGSEGLWVPGFWKKLMPIPISLLIEVAKTGVWPKIKTT